MNIPLLNFLFPNMCCICKRYGNYICDDCKKLLKRNLPECYICRRLSPQYSSHTQCRKCCSLDNVFVGWEYNHMSSSILKLYKYKNVREISMGLSPPPPPPPIQEEMRGVLIRWNILLHVLESILI